MISIVEDDEAVRESTKRLILSLGYAAATFASAEEYLDSDRVDDTSCLITDIRLPGMNGIDLQERLVAAGYRTPIIIMTALPHENIRARALKTGAVGFLSKPLADDCLIKCLNAALGSCGTGAK